MISGASGQWAMGNGLSPSGMRKPVAPATSTHRAYPPILCPDFGISPPRAPPILLPIAPLEAHLRSTSYASLAIASSSRPSLPSSSPLLLSSAPSPPWPLAAARLRLGLWTVVPSTQKSGLRTHNHPRPRPVAPRVILVGWDLSIGSQFYPRMSCTGTDPLVCCLSFANNSKIHARTRLSWACPSRHKCLRRRRF